MKPSDVHRILMGKEPETEHSRLYDADRMGFSDKTFDKSRFLAVAMLTLSKTLRTAQPSRVVLLIAPSHDKWVVEEFDNISAVAFKSIKKHPGSLQGRVLLAKLFGDAFKTVFYCSRLLQLPDQPESWTAFGFTREDPIPDWMRAGLL